MDLAQQLGGALLEHGWLTADRMRRALEVQRDSGGSFGTCLLELGFVTEERLLETLSELHGCPPATAADLRKVRSNAIAQLPAELARRRRAVPFRIVGGELWVALENPADEEGQAEIMAVSRRQLRSHVTTEPRVFEALNAFYAQPCPQRFALLLARLNRPPSLWEEARSRLPRVIALTEEEKAQLGAPEAVIEPAPEVIAVEAAAAPQPQVPAPQPPPAAPAPPLVHAEPALAEPVPAEPVPAEPVPEGAAPAEALAAEEEPPAEPPRRREPIPPAPPELEHHLEAAASLDDIGRAVLAHVAPLFHRSLLFKVTPEGVAGWLGQGGGADAEKLQHFTAGFDRPSVFLNLRQGTGLHLGPLAPMEVHLELAKLWGGELPAAAVVAPIRVRDRLVAVLYADGQRAVEGGPAALDWKQAQAAAASCAAAFELYLMQRKTRKS